MVDSPLNQSIGPSPMLKSRPFWLFNNLVLTAFHIGAIVALSLDANAFEQLWVKIWALLLVLHVMELPIAFLATKERPASLVQTILMTILFGFTWWLPVRLGVFGKSPIVR